jgi:hypothetical protein
MRTPATRAPSRRTPRIRRVWLSTTWPASRSPTSDGIEHSRAVRGRWVRCNLNLEAAANPRMSRIAGPVAGAGGWLTSGIGTSAHYRPVPQRPLWRLHGQARHSARRPGLTQCMVRPCVARGFRRVGGEPSCINVSGLWLELVGLRAIMEISAPAISLAVRPQRAIRVTSVRKRREDQSSISSHLRKHGQKVLSSGNGSRNISFASSVVWQWGDGRQ